MNRLQCTSCYASAHESKDTPLTPPDRLAALALLLCAGIVNPLTCFGNSLSVTAGTTQSTAVEEDAIQVSGPTLIAFFAPASQSESDERAELSEIMSDFQWHLGRARESLESSGVSVHERYDRAIRILNGGKMRVYMPSAETIGIGYYLVSLNREPKVLEGIFTDVDLVAAAKSYFVPPTPGPTPKSDDPPYSITNGRLHVFGYSLQPNFEIKLPTSLDDDDTSSISFSRSDDGRWIVIHHERDVNSSEFWLYDDETRKKPFHLQIGSGRHGDIAWHGNRLFEVQYFGMGYTISIFVRVDDPENPVHTADLLHYDGERDIYVSFFPDGVEIGRLFDLTSAKERFPIALEYVSAVDARMTIEKVDIKGKELVVTHTRRDGSLAVERFLPDLLER